VPRQYRDVLAPFAQRRNANRVDIEPMKQVGAKLPAATSASRSRLVAGNGWTDYASFNPYYSVSAWTNLKLHRFLGVFARAEWKRQRVNMQSYDPVSPPVDPAVVRGTHWLGLWALELGGSFSF